MQSSAPLSCHNLSFNYRQNRIIDSLSEAFKAGEFVGLIGPNGAGKSTFLQLLLGLLQPCQGEIRLQAHNIKQLRRNAIAQKIAFVPQDQPLDFAFSVMDIVAMGRMPYLKKFQIESKQDLDIIHKALERTDLLALKEHCANELSGGERQRLFIAQALAQQTDILILDEPTSNLDLCHQLDLMNLLSQFSGEGLLCIAALHDLELAARYCQRLMLIYKGKIVAKGSAQEVITASNLRQYFAIEAHVEKDNYGHLRIVAQGPANP